MIVVALAGSAVLSSLRWLRVAQREHYLAGSVIRFARRWWTADSRAVTLAALTAVAVVASTWQPPAALVAAVAVAMGPPGLGVKGRTSPLAWTPRLRRLAVAVGAMAAVGLSIGWSSRPVVAAVTVAALPVLFDVALAVLAPLERRLGGPWVATAAAALRRSGAEVVAITGSYGKTTTKGYVAQLLASERRVLASPASFNNRMGLARAVNEHLAGDVDVFVAEMGTYGPGEIADLCSWIPPDIAVITAIGPVHLERFRTEERIVAAKAEILEGARVAVLNVDDPRLATLAETHEARRRVIRVGTAEGLDVTVADGRVLVGGEAVGDAPSPGHPGNVACAVGVAVALGIEPVALSRRLPGLSEPEHRRTVVTGSRGVVVIDDTFNSNPAGARTALRVLEEMPVPGRRVVVTPGMVELGPRQHEENRAFAFEAGRVADELVVVGSTNREALSEGASMAGMRTTQVADRDHAVSWVREHLGQGDTVLYENDLPDHYP